MSSTRWRGRRWKGPGDGDLERLDFDMSGLRVWRCGDVDLLGQVFLRGVTLLAFLDSLLRKVNCGSKGRRRVQEQRLL